MTTINYEEKLHEILSSKLKEKVPHSMLDSGDYYGRHYQENQERDFRSEDSLHVEVFGDQAIFHYNLYHFLVNFLKVDEESEQLQKKLEIYMSESDDSHFAAMKTFGENEGYDTYTGNTYNGENILSQGFQHTTYCTAGSDSIYGVEFVAIMIHGGCDIRGGYTSPYIFKTREEGDISPLLCSMTDVYAFVDRHDPEKEGIKSLFEGAEIQKRNLESQSDDGGYNWYGDFSLKDDNIEFDEKHDKVYYNDTDGLKYEIRFGVSEE